MKTIAISLTILLLYAFFPASADETGIDHVNIYVNDFSREFFTDMDTPESRDIRTGIRDLMTAAGLSYELKFVPASRVWHVVEASDNALMLQLVRTPSREDQFHWLMPLSEPFEIAVYGRSADNISMNVKQAAREGSYTSACEKQSYMCEYLKQFGFPDSSIFEVVIHRRPLLEYLMLNERIDLVVGIPVQIERNLSSLEIEPGTIEKIAVLAHTADYLAAPVHIRDDIAAKLLAAQRKLAN